MLRIDAFGVIDNPLEPLDVVEMLRTVVPVTCKIKLVDVFPELSTKYFWKFGSDYDEEAPKLWLKSMEEGGYLFENAVLYVDETGAVAGLWPNENVQESENALENSETSGSTIVADDEETEVKEVDELKISASVILTGTTEDGKTKKFKARGTYKKERAGLVDTIAIDKENDLNKEDLQVILDWVNECNLELIDFTLEGPAYCASQSHIHNFSLGRIVLDQMHVAVLSTMISRLQDTLNKIKPPTSALY